MVMIEILSVIYGLIGLATFLVLAVWMSLPEDMFSVYPIEFFYVLLGSALWPVTWFGLAILLAYSLFGD